MQAEPLISEIANLLPAPAARPEEISVEPCAGGGNNRVFTVSASGRSYVAKFYFRHPSDTRDRLKAEYAFLSYAKRIGVTCVPAPIACDTVHGIGLYEHIDGRKLASHEIDAAAGTVKLNGGGLVVLDAVELLQKAGFYGKLAKAEKK